MSLHFDNLHTFNTPLSQRVYSKKKKFKRSQSCGHLTPKHMTTPLRTNQTRQSIMNTPRSIMKTPLSRRKTPLSTRKTPRSFYKTPKSSMKTPKSYKKTGTPRGDRFLPSRGADLELTGSQLINGIQKEKETSQGWGNVSTTNLQINKNQPLKNFNRSFSEHDLCGFTKPIEETVITLNSKKQKKSVNNYSLALSQNLLNSGGRGKLKKEEGENIDPLINTRLLDFENGINENNYSSGSGGKRSNSSYGVGSGKKSKRSVQKLRDSAKLTNSQKKPKQSDRYIAKAPEQILDAPDVVKDYYLNLLDWSKDNLLAVALSNSVYLWNAETSEIALLFENEQEHNIVTSLSWIQEGSVLAVGLNDSVVQLWDTNKSAKLRSMKSHSARVSSLSWNQHILSSGSKDSTIINNDVRIHDHKISTLKCHQQEVCGLKWSPDGKMLASGSDDNLCLLWDCKTTTKKRKNTGSSSSISPLHVLKGHVSAVKALDWCSWKSNLLATGGGSADKTIRFWNTQSGKCLKALDTGSQVCSVLWSKTTKELISSHGFSEYQLSVWNYPSLRKITDLKGHTARVLYTTMSPNCDIICSCGADETLRFWNTFPQKKTKSLMTNTTLKSNRKQKKKTKRSSNRPKKQQMDLGSSFR
ncbi:cell division cycle 20 cdc20 fizzy -related [Anaeramoeba flamelloides]|uniref:Cell division cycle 20 cdc20 fizzy -related n=1 Tax=Anaeramoeba flamelloides TaxID=1746091 RepID=A0AAV7Z820_9EUKA|nr:cell division cycle 20 cdc20 fizzy -related [Anaeramoeba flamelloides]